MSDEKHSPGPWRAEQDRGGLGYLIYPPSQVSIGAVDFEADARLIAAAPELLELLRRWNVSVGTAEEMERLETATTALLKRIDGASCGTCGMEDGHFTDCPIFKARQHCHSCGLIGDQHTDDCGAPR